MSGMSRRLFLEETLLAAAAMAVAEPERVLADGAKPAKSPNERLNVAVIGVRGRGQNHVDAFAAQKDCQVTCVCDADRNVGMKYVEKLAAKGQKVRFVLDMRELFDDKSIDIVSVATPNHWHSLAAIWAMQAGKDVYVEKPVSHNISEGRRMIQAARKYNRICQGGTQHRSAGSAKAAAQYVREGKLGKIKLVRCVMHRGRKSIGPAGNYPVPAGVDYNLWAGPAPMAPVTRKSFHYDWHWFWDFGCGEIGNNNIHAVDTARFISGLQGLGRGVMSYGGRLAFHDAAETPNTQVAIHDFGDVTLAQEVRNLKTAAPRFGAAILIMGTEGYVASAFGNAQVYDLAGKPVQVLKGKGDDHFANFVKAVRSRKREDQNADILEGHQSTALVHLANISYRLGKQASAAEIIAQIDSHRGNENAVDTFEAIRRHLAENDVDVAKDRLALGPWLAFNSEKETFVDNTAADAMLTRPYRKPFVVPTEQDV